MNRFRTAVTRAGHPANCPAATAMAYRFGFAAVFRERNMIYFLRKFMLGSLVACALIASSAPLASAAHPAVAAQAASHPLKVCDAPGLCI